MTQTHPWLPAPLSDSPGSGAGSFLRPLSLLSPSQRASLPFLDIETTPASTPWGSLPFPAPDPRFPNTTQEHCPQALARASGCNTTAFCSQGLAPFLEQEWLLVSRSQVPVSTSLKGKALVHGPTPRAPASWWIESGQVLMDIHFKESPSPPRAKTPTRTVRTNRKCELDIHTVAPVKGIRPAAEHLLHHFQIFLKHSRC